MRQTPLLRAPEPADTGGGEPPASPKAVKRGQKTGSDPAIERRMAELEDRQDQIGESLQGVHDFLAGAFDSEGKPKPGTAPAAKPGRKELPPAAQGRSAWDDLNEDLGL